MTTARPVRRQQPAPNKGPTDAARTVGVENLCIRDVAATPVLDGVSFEIHSGQRVALIGPSGSGKTTLALALLGYQRPGLRRDDGRITVAGQDVTALSGRALRALRRHTIAYLPQNPAAVLTPTLRVAAQVRELGRDGHQASDQVAAQLRAVGLPDDLAFQRRLPHQLSGGQQQRLALARALATDPAVLVLDEPTTGLDAATIDLVLTETSRLVDQRHMTLVMITHDLAAARQMAERQIALHAGRIIDDGPIAGAWSEPTVVIDRPTPLPSPRPRPSTTVDAGRSVTGTEMVLSVEHLRARHRDGPLVLDDIGFQLERGQCLALLGRSGRGKTTLARCLVGHHLPASGTIALDGQRLAPSLRKRTVAQRQALQLIPQDASGSLNPRRRIGAAIARPARLLGGLDRAAAHDRTRDVLDLVRLNPDYANRYPGELSGGQRQRAAIARALAAEPTVLICDEITSDLDATTQTAIYDLISTLRARLGLAVVMITHDQNLVARYADRVLQLPEDNPDDLIEQEFR